MSLDAFVFTRPDLDSLATTVESAGRAARNRFYQILTDSDRPIPAEFAALVHSLRDLTAVHRTLRRMAGIPLAEDESIDDDAATSADVAPAAPDNPDPSISSISSISSNSTDPSESSNLSDLSDASDGRVDDLPEPPYGNWTTPRAPGHIPVEQRILGATPILNDNLDPPDLDSS
jgi:hypothetical protein